MKVTVFIPTLDVFISAIDDRFKQETTDLIIIIGKLINLDLDAQFPGLYILEKLLNIKNHELLIEIQLLTNIQDTPKRTSSKCIYKMDR